MSKSNYLWPAGAFTVICLLGFGARYAIGDIYSAAEARVLIEALSRAGLYLGSAIATASATVLALMLTMIGLIRRIDEDFDHQAYRNINLVATLATASLLMSISVLLAFTLPVGEFEELPNWWYSILYEILYSGSVMMVALIAATVMMMYRTLSLVLARITPGDDV